MPDQEEVDETFLRQVEEASFSQAVVLMGDFNDPNICWSHNTNSTDNPGGFWSTSMTTSYKE